MKKLLCSVLLAVVFCTASTSHAISQQYADKEKGWHKGTYFLVGAGYMNLDSDTHVQTGNKFGKDRVLGYGLTFGWNFIDWLAAELSTRYATEKAANQREHAANIDINAKYSLILDALTKWEKIRFLPYGKIGGGIFGAAVPDTRAGNDRFGVYGPSMNVGIGMELLLIQNLYVGVEFTEHFVWLQEKFRGTQKILNGGFDAQDSVFGYVGTHF